MDLAHRSHDPGKYHKFKKVDGASYNQVNQFLRKRTFITAREWAISRLCADFQTSSGAEMTFIGRNLPELVPFMTGTYTPQAVNQARSSFKKKVNKAGSTFLYGAMCGFYTPEELDDLLFEASEVARFLLEIESTAIGVDEEIEIEDQVTGIMRQVAEASARLLKLREEQQRAKLEKKKKLTETEGSDSDEGIGDQIVDLSDATQFISSTQDEITGISDSNSGTDSIENNPAENQPDPGFQEYEMTDSQVKKDERSDLM